jgi:hypothetical protein
MTFTLGSIIVKGGKVVGTGYNHQRPHYDEVLKCRTAAKPVSMHAEMHAIFNLTGGLASPTKWHVLPDTEASSFSKPGLKQCLQRKGLRLCSDAEASEERKERSESRQQCASQA